MNKVIIFSSLMLCSLAWGQFTPPSSAVSTVSVNSSNKLVAPTATEFLQANPEIFPTANIRTLTIGTGLSGSNYSVTNATTWSINTTWLLQNYHKNLTIGDGLKLESGNTYNGTTAHTASVDKNNLLSWINSLQRNFYVFVNMSPTPVDNTSYKMKVTKQTSNLYYKAVSGVRQTTKTATNSLMLHIFNNTNLVQSTNSSMPSSYNSANFNVVNMEASLSGDITYETADGVTVVNTRVTNSAGQSSYSTNDVVWDLSYWTDCELKVIDQWGNIVYFTSTIGLNSSGVLALHPQITDTNPTIYFFGTYRYATSGCYGLRTQFTNFNSSIGATIGGSYTVSGIWIYPNLSSQETRRVPNWTGYNQQSGTKQVVWGKYIREVFENPNNTIIIWRQTIGRGELYNKNKLWRPVQITYYGDWTAPQN